MKNILKRPNQCPDLKLFKLGISILMYIYISFATWNAIRLCFASCSNVHEYSWLNVRAHSRPNFLFWNIWKLYLQKQSKIFKVSIRSAWRHLKSWSSVLCNWFKIITFRLLSGCVLNRLTELRGELVELFVWCWTISEAYWVRLIEFREGNQG